MAKKVIVLIDEYDVPLAYAAEYGYYDEMIALMRMILDPLKDNDLLEFVVLSGCLRVSKDSLFTGLNNFQSFGVGESKFADKFGFTHQEVKELLRIFGLEDRFELMKKWYDGYVIGYSQEQLFCPWDIASYIMTARNEPKAEPVPYWASTGSYEIFKGLIAKFADNIQDQAELLLKGESIKAEYSNLINYHSLDSRLNNFWMMLFATGYLSQSIDSRRGSEIELKIPNLSVKEVFQNVFEDLMYFRLGARNFSDLQQAFFNLDAKAIKLKINTFLRNTISYNDYQESFYHGMTAGFWENHDKALIVESNREYGLGRPDLVITDTDSYEVLIIELKTASSESELEKRAHQAVQQIIE